MNDISWRGIRAFLHVAEHKSFTAAAAASGASKSNLSQLVSELEAALGVQLLHRTTRKLRMTDIGQGYYERCKQAMIQLDSAAEWAAEATHDLRGEIRMNSVGGLLGEEVVAPLVLGFQQRYPDVNVMLSFSSMRVDIIEDHYDLVLRMGRLPDSTLIARTLKSITTRYVASPAFVKKHGSLENPQDLKKVPLIYGSVDHWIMKRGTEQQIIHVEGGIKAASGRIMRKAALSGLGVTRLGDVNCQADISQGRLVEVLPDWSEDTAISLVCPPVRYQLARVRALMTWLAERFDGQHRKVLDLGPDAM
ncbi:LysR substrate-binding domain-containing protein [Paracoccus sp. Z330]|uniref:LysR substrate-binding domain-containing protein n=1 Tax=Paracoccus onchidii TaxID=3017813 RepID=A0ABT4ZH81_9RHOB|nr:LysR family transcriptional regulator [Paracoccus onchidii]MDB6178457.1 LysR substrate-binding domain-containing protein [Paracoccus onchidii]